MKKLLLTAFLAMIAVPVAFAVPPAGDHADSAKKCKAERAAMGVAAFNDKYGTNANKNAFGKCVSSTAKESEAQHQEDAQNAAKQCKAERALGVAAFNDKYGTNKNKKNAFGKCVSGKVQELEDEHEAEHQAELNAAKKCKAERALGVAAFNDKYGTNANNKNAFGKCVSKNAKPVASP